MVRPFVVRQSSQFKLQFPLELSREQALSETATKLLFLFASLFGVRAFF